MATVPSRRYLAERGVAPMDIRIVLAVIAVVAIGLAMAEVIGPALALLVVVACAVVAFVVLPRYSSR